MRRDVWCGLIAALVAFAGTTAVMAEDAAAVRTAVEKAAADYAAAYNARDYEKLAEQWTAGARLVEGGSQVNGRGPIVASIRGWLERHPKASLQVRIDTVDLASETLARVEGTLSFMSKPGATPAESRFTSLRVLERGAWRIAESVVEPSHAAALDDMAWLLGTWTARDAESGTAIDAVYERVIGGRAIIGRIRITRKDGPPVESLELMYADRAAGVIRATVHDSTGAHAEGVVESDGTAFNRSLAGAPGDRVKGSRTQWVQTIVPGGDGRFTIHSIERSLDGRPLPDGQPMHFTRK